MTAVIRTKIRSLVDTSIKPIEINWPKRSRPLPCAIEFNGLPEFENVNCVFFVTGSNDESGLTIMLNLAEMSLKDNLRPLSPIPLRLIDGEWEDWEFPKPHPEFAQYHQLHHQYFGELYECQKALLDVIHEKDEIDIFVASFSGIRHDKTGEVWSYCVWTKDCDSMIPKTDLIMLEVSGGSLSCKWDDAAKIVGDMMQPVDDLYPIRYRVRMSPSDEQLAMIPKFEL